MRDDVRSKLEALGIGADTLVPDDDGTLLADARPPQQTSELPPPVLSVADTGGVTGVDFELQETIGAGAMATVWSARQPSLDRRVAVKELRPERRSDKARNELLHEARVAGTLEHPNIVPVHSLGLREDGWPVIVMKYIEGKPWKQALEPLHASPEPPPDERVEEQLRIFMQVCTAVDFAHDRGIIHRDLKPDNVMIGAFQEVYVVDWGLALRLGQDGCARPEDVTGVAGTPGYMAPEMVGVQAHAIGPRTDVYLLGAVLHELITGARPHQGGSIAESLVRAHESAVQDYAEWVPEELAAICRRAMHRDPNQRYASAAALREAVTEFIRHRSVVSLIEEAWARYVRLRDEHETVDASVLVSLAAEARFGFRQALRQRPDDLRAKRGLVALLELLAEREIARENVHAAEAELAALRELGLGDRSALEASLAELRTRLAARERDAADLDKLRRESSLRVNVALRRRLATINGTVLASGAGLLFMLRKLGVYEASYGALMGFCALLTVTVAIGGWVLDRHEGNRANRQIFGAIAVGCAASVLLFGVAWAGDMDIVAAEAMSMIVAATCSGVLATTLDRSLGWTGVCFVLAAILVIALPELRGLWIAVVGGSGFAVGSLVWRKLTTTEGQAKQPG
jgi:tRNA A-37 threonylcarbamoyl transferase component Bud32